MHIHIAVQTEVFDPAVEERLLCEGNPRIGAVVTFLGLMRDINNDEQIGTMTLEHYPGMTEKALAAIVDEAGERWDLEGIRVIHRVGELLPEDPIVLVMVASRHRGEAFRACEFVIDYLKTRAPFWKKEKTPKGERWVEARHGDREAEARW
ncbi:molybdopterin synthase catalytic subunit MoaE [Thiolapillus sp.]